MLECNILFCYSQNSNMLSPSPRLASPYRGRACLSSSHLVALEAAQLWRLRVGLEDSQGHENTHEGHQEVPRGLALGPT